jgi:hypothetical protein
MKKVLLFAIAVLAVLGLSGLACEKEEAEEIRDYNAADYHKVTIITDNGDVSADVEAGQDITVTFTKTGEDLGEIDITEDSDGVNLTITVEMPETPVTSTSPFLKTSRSICKRLTAASP